MKTDVIINRDALYALRELPSESVNCCVTSPPYYGLRDYGLDAQIGREDTPEQYIGRLVEVFRELRRVLKDDGTFWLNIADTYCGSGMKAGCKQKDLIGIPWLLAFALRSDGWYLRSDIIWLKENPMPESCRDRPSRCYEHIFLLTKYPKWKPPLDCRRCYLGLVPQSKESGKAPGNARGLSYGNQNKTSEKQTRQ